MKRLNEREIIDLITSYIDDQLLDEVKNDDVVIFPLRNGFPKRMNQTSNMNIVLKSDMLVESTDVTIKSPTIAPFLLGILLFGKVVTPIILQSMINSLDSLVFRQVRLDLHEPDNTG